jgi:hypothetical protein
VSQLAVDILHPVGETERKLALVEAAFHPEIFNTLKEQFPDGVSEASLRSYLVRQNFMDRAISPLSKAYVETCAFLEQSGASDSHRNAASGAAGSILDEEDDMIEAAELGRPDPQPAPAPTKAQVFSAAPTVGPPSVAEVSNLPPEGFSQAIFPLVDGQVSLTFPAELSSDGYAELSEYLAIFLKRAERQRRQQEAAKRDDLPGVG